MRTCAASNAPVRRSNAVPVRTSSACSGATSLRALAFSASASVRTASSAACADVVDLVHSVATSSPAAVCNSAGRSGCSIRTRLFSRNSTQNSPSRIQPRASSGSSVRPGHFLHPMLIGSRAAQWAENSTKPTQDTPLTMDSLRCGDTEHHRPMVRALISASITDSSELAAPKVTTIFVARSPNVISFRLFNYHMTSRP
ncbi:hypothetical protein R75465_08161 [Paraburkholderia aspalathi]|nr:hypothetical protein R75465_08161 [Paraburkholderia aspalathi]